MVSRAKGFSRYPSFLDDLVTKIVDNPERNLSDLYRARRKKDATHCALPARVRSAAARDVASSPRDGSDSCSMRVFINTGRRAGFVKSALVPGALVQDEGHVLQTSRECRREKASAFRDFRCRTDKSGNRPP